MPNAREYHEHPVHPGLRHCVERISTEEQFGPLHDSPTIKLVADSTVRLGVRVVARSWASGSPLAQADDLSVYVVGPSTGAKEIPRAGTAAMIVVRFRPTATVWWLGAHTDALVDRLVLPGDVASTLFAQLASDVSGAVSLDDARKRIEAALLSRLSSDRQARSQRAEPAVDRALAILEASHGNARIADVCDEVGVPLRRLHKAFTRWTGVSPKWYGRWLRFHHVMESVVSHEQLHWAGMAVDAGFHDQAHLVRDFKEFSGMSPAAFFRDWYACGCPRRGRPDASMAPPTQQGSSTWPCAKTNWARDTGTGMTQ